AELDRLREDDLLLGAEQRHAGDLPQVQARRVLDVERLLVDDLGRLVVRVRDRRGGGDHGLDRLGLHGRNGELVVGRSRLEPDIRCGVSSLDTPAMDISYPKWGRSGNPLVNTPDQYCEFFICPK